MDKNPSSTFQRQENGENINAKRYGPLSESKRSSWEDLNSSDLVFPVLAKDPAVEMHGFYFLTAYDAPSAYYFSLKKSGETILKEVVHAYVNLWPFLLICLLFAFISGFIVWIVEGRKNKDEFASHFCPGMFDGFWWSFIAMTTVGFGDKVSKW